MRIWVLILAVFWRHPELLQMFGETVALGAWPRYNDESGFSIEAVLKVPRAALYVDAWLGVALPLLRLVLVYPAAEWSSNLWLAACRAAVPLGVVLCQLLALASPGVALSSNVSQGPGQCGSRRRASQGALSPARANGGARSVAAASCAWTSCAIRRQRCGVGSGAPYEVC